MSVETLSRDDNNPIASGSPAKMPQNANPYPPWEFPTGPAEEIINRAQQDLVFSMQFLGESQHLLMQYFCRFIAEELGRHGVDQETHPLLQLFVDTHAAELRDFVFAGVALSRQFRIVDIEDIIGDSTKLLRTDIWDQLTTYIQTAEAQFQAQAKDFPDMLAQMKHQVVQQGGA